jgi:uncharacterized protein (TIGR00725 family)
LSESKVVAIFGSSQVEPGTQAWLDAETAGSRCAAQGIDIATGGYGGAMEAASKGAVKAGGHVIGVTAPELFSRRSGANSYVTREIEAKTLTERIGILTELAHGVIVLPGSIGTAAELVIAWNLNHIARRNGGVRLPTVAVGKGWSELWRLMTERLDAHGDDIHTVDSIDEAISWLLAQPEIRRIQHGPV